MEAFSLLKFWKSSPPAAAGLVTPLPACGTTLHADVSGKETRATSAGDDGPFFDLEFSGEEGDEEEESVADLVCVSGDGGEVEVEESEETETEDDERTDPNPPASPSDDILNILAVEAGSNHNSGKPQAFPVSLLRSATKLRILVSGSKKSSKSDSAQPQAQSCPKKSRRTRKLFTIKFKPDELPIVSLFTRDHSSRPANGVVSSFPSSASTSCSSSSSSLSSSLKPRADSDDIPPATADSMTDSDEKRNPKDGVQKYIKMVKPLYIRVSKRYSEKMQFSGQFSFEKPAETPQENSADSAEKQESVKDRQKKAPTSLGDGLKVMIRKRMAGKKTTAEAGVVHPAAPLPTVRQRNDSLIQQQEWIQGAILHCKKSFHSSSRENEESESESVLTRSSSDPLHEKVAEAQVADGLTKVQNDVVQSR